MTPRTTNVLRLAAATAALVGSTVVTGAAPAGATGSACTPNVLPGLTPDNFGDIVSMNDSGLVGGEALDADGVDRGVYWTHSGSDPANGWTIHQVPSSFVDAFIGGITSTGLMVGTGTDPATGRGRGYVFNPSTQALTMLPSLGGDDYDRRINDAGVVTGTSVDANGVQHAVTWSPPYAAPKKLPDVGGSQKFRTPDGTFYRFGNGASGINNRGQVVGGSLVGAPFDNTGSYARQGAWRGVIAPLQEAVEWQANGSPSKLSTNRGQGNAWAINDAGLIVGNVADAQTFNGRPTAWISGRPVDMGAPADTNGSAYGVSQGGWAAGGYWNSDFSATSAFRWSQADGFVSLDMPGMVDTWSHTASDVLRQVGGQADPGDNSLKVPVIWQC